MVCNIVIYTKKKTPGIVDTKISQAVGSKISEELMARGKTQNETF